MAFDRVPLVDGQTFLFPKPTMDAIKEDVLQDVDLDPDVTAQVAEAIAKDPTLSGAVTQVTADRTSVAEDRAAVEKARDEIEQLSSSAVYAAVSDEDGILLLAPKGAVALDPEDPNVVVISSDSETPFSVPKLDAGGRVTESVLPSRLSSSELSDAYASRSKRVKTRGRLTNWGHSYAFGIGSSDEAKRMARIVADHYRLDEVNEAVSGTAFATDGSGASFGKFLQHVTRSSGGVISGGAAMPPSGLAGFSTPGGLHSLLYGVNDVNLLGNTKAALEPVRQAFRTAISRLRAGVIIESDHAACAYSASDWSLVAGSSANSGANYRQTPKDGAAYQIQLPEDFPGGTISIGIIAPSGVGNGGTHSTTSLGTPRSFRAYGTRTGSATHFVWRLDGVPAGARVIFVTVSGVVTATSFDYLQWEASNEKSPLVLLHTQPHCPDYSAYGAVAPGPPTPTGVNFLNEIIREVASEFGDRCLVVDHSNMDNDPTMFAPDKLHPSDKGNALMAANTIAAIEAAGFIVESGEIIRPRYDYGTAAPSGTRTFYRQGDYVENTSPSELGSTGAKYFVNGWKCLTSGRPATWVEDRRVTGN